jgi:hypothetical protein
MVAPVIDYGLKFANTPINSSFEIKNIGFKPDKLIKAVGDCSCFVAVMPSSEVILPGQPLKIPFTLKSLGSGGRFHHEFALQFQDSPPLRQIITGWLLTDDIHLENWVIDLGVLPPKKQVTSAIQFVCRSELKPGLRIESEDGLASCPIEWLQNACDISTQTGIACGQFLLSPQILEKYKSSQSIESTARLSFVGSGKTKNQHVITVKWSQGQYTEPTRTYSLGRIQQGQLVQVKIDGDWDASSLMLAQTSAGIDGADYKLSLQDLQIQFYIIDQLEGVFQGSLHVSDKNHELSVVVVALVGS